MYSTLSLLIRYREGKQAGVEHIYSKEGDKYFASLDGLEEIENELVRREKEDTRDVEKKQGESDQKQ